MSLNDEMLKKILPPCPHPSELTPRKPPEGDIFGKNKIPIFRVFGVNAKHKHATQKTEHGEKS